MLYRMFIGFFVVLSLFFSCTRNHSGAIAGRVVSPPAGTSITALQHGTAIASAAITSQDGTFIMVLPAGTYDISVSSPASPFPLQFPGIIVEPDKTATLPPLDLAPPSGHAALSGRIFPVGLGAKISLILDGRERASVIADTEGRFRFTDLPAGTYILQAKADTYAADSVTVTVEQDQSVILNMGLFYQTAIDGVDWASGKIRVFGEGIPPAGAPNDTIRREMARRAALADAQRNVLKVIEQIRVGPDQTLKSFWGDRKYTTIIHGFVQGYAIRSEHETSGGAMRIELELPLTGEHGLSRALFR